LKAVQNATRKKDAESNSRTIAAQEIAPEVGLSEEGAAEGGRCELADEEEEEGEGEEVEAGFSREGEGRTELEEVVEDRMASPQNFPKKLNRNRIKGAIGRRTHAGANLSLIELVAQDCTSSRQRIGRPQALSVVEVDHLIQIVQRDFYTRRFPIVDLKREAGFSHVCDTTISCALHAQGFKPYVEEFKFILKPENKLQRLAFCEERKGWQAEIEWANYRYTDEMSIEIGGNFGICLVWRRKDERWEENCVGAKKKQGPKMMCWGMISYGHKGPFHVWDKETTEEWETAEKEIGELNRLAAEKEKRLNEEWKRSEEWKILREEQLETARLQRELARAAGIAAKITALHRRKKFKIEKITRGERKGVDSWRYVKHIGRPLLWPKCKALLALNSSFVLMEDNASLHTSHFTTAERQKEGISKLIWPPNSPDFNPIERIWTLMKRLILHRRGSEKITTATAMKTALIEEWERITIDEINHEINLLSKIMELCIAQKGGNKYHA